jgi:hypothetical protein
LTILFDSKFPNASRDGGTGGDLFEVLEASFSGNQHAFTNIVCLELSHTKEMEASVINLIIPSSSSQAWNLQESIMPVVR